MKTTKRGMTIQLTLAGLLALASAPALNAQTTEEQRATIRAQVEANIQRMKEATAQMLLDRLMAASNYAAQFQAESESMQFNFPFPGGGGGGTNPPPAPDLRRNAEKFARQTFSMIDTNAAAIADTNLYNACMSFPADTNMFSTLQIARYGANAVIVKANHFDYSAETERDFALLVSDSVNDPVRKSIDFAPQMPKTVG